MMPGSVIPEVDEYMGFWKPHSSSIDFCERNYENSHHIVELHNTWSSLVGMSLFGLIGLIWGNPTKEIRHTLAHSILLFIGLGSAGLHGTLHWIFQSSDELPMVYLVAVYMYMGFELDSKKDQLHYPRMPLMIFILLLINTVVYYAFQHLFIVFFLTFSTLATVNAFLLYNNAIRKNMGGEMGRRIGRRVLIAYVGIGFPSWCIDMGMCDWVLEHVANATFGMTLHVIWHISAGYGAYCITLTLEYCRMVSLGLPCDCKFWMGIIPVNYLLEAEGLEKTDASNRKTGGKKDA
eukprot:259078_1